MVWPARNKGYACDEPKFFTIDTPLIKKLWWMLTGQYAIKRLELLAKYQLDRYMHFNWIDQDDTGFTGWRWERYPVQRRIVCAANRYKDIIVTGPRHYSNLMHSEIEAYGGVKLLRKYAGNNLDQGFIDQFGTYYTREEAKILAQANCQILYAIQAFETQLFSEHLY